VAAGALAVVIFTSSSSLVSAKPTEAGRPEVIPGKYIVVFHDDVTDTDAVGQELALQHGLSIEHTYHSTLQGFSGAVPAGKLEAIKNDSRVAFVSEDAVVAAYAKPAARGPITPPAQLISTGIARIGSQANTATGLGIGVAVIDTGIDLTHADLAANVVADTNCVNTRKSGNDDNGHGTHVAGTIAGLNNTINVVGVAPEASLIAVKVLNSQGSGSWSEIICGLDWVTANAATYNIQVVNMSLGGAGSSDDNCGLTNNETMHLAVCNTRDAGITIVVAAGNSTVDTATQVPAAYDDAVITVSALADSDGSANGLGTSTSYGANDTFASFSNFGSEVDIAAPGVNIYSTWKSGGYSTISGTSMASPHVAAAAALYSQSHPGSSWTQVRDGLSAAAEALNAGHTDPGGLHGEPLLQAATF